MRYFSLLIILLSLAQAQFNHPELEWRTLEGEHFIVHFHQETEWTANEALHVADEIYPAITSLYQYEPEEKTHLIIKDTDDYANGAAYYFDNKIEIWAMPLDYELRGSHYWLRDVITHEFTHIVSLRAARKFPGKTPAGYFQVISYEPERREDVLYGYPNGIASYPIPSVVVPMWWAEGIAQFQNDTTRWDWWDSIRDMILRDRISYSKLLTFNEMDGFGKAGIGNESVYDHGFSMARFLAANYGQDVLKRITERISNPMSFGFYRSLEAEIGRSRDELWKSWRRELMENHAASFIPDEALSPIHFIQRAGDANFRPEVNPATGEIAFISNAGETNLSRVSLFVKAEQKTSENIIQGAEGFDWDPEGKRLVFSRKEYYDGGIPPARGSQNHHLQHLQDVAQAGCERCQFLISGSRYADLFIVPREDLKEEVRLTHGERVKNPSWSPDGKLIAFVNLRDGTNNICLISPEQPDSIRQITDFKSGTQVFGPQWSSDSRRLIFDFTDGSNRDISVFNLETGELEALLDSPWDERDPRFKDDRTVLFSDDRTGIFNIYALDLETRNARRLTNVNGGAFHATWAEDKLYYALYDSLGYNIAVLHENELLAVEPQPNQAYLQRIIPPTWEAHEQTRMGEDYLIKYGPMFIIPRLQLEIDQSKHDVILKPGFYFFSDELLNNYSLMGGLGISPNLDMDLFIGAQYRSFLPTMNLEFFQMIRHTNELLRYYVNEETNEATYTVDADLTFSLTQGVLSLDLGLPPNFGLRADISASNYRTTIGNHSVQGLAAGGISYDYFKGWDWGLQWQFSKIARRQERDINPSGYSASISFRDNHHFFLDGYGYDEDADAWGNIFSPYHYVKLNMSGFYGLRLPIPGQFVLSNATEIYLIDHNGIDDFFFEFAGGLPGLKGYPFYSMKGTRRVVSSTSLRFPIFRDNYSRVAQLTVRDLYAGFHAQIGSAWMLDPAMVTPDDFQAWMDAERDQIRWVRDIGMDLRLAMNSYYAYPTAFELGAFYGLDEFSIQPNTGAEVSYGGEWRFYWKVLFGFN